MATEALKNILREKTNWQIHVYDLASYLRTIPARQDENVLILDKGATAQCFTSHLRFIKHARPGVKMIAVDHALQPDEECLLLFLGVHGLVTYGNVRGQLRAAVQAVQEGHLWFNPQRLHNYADYLNRRMKDERRASSTHLTQREHEIVRLIKHGLLNSQIAVELGISCSTVKFHVGHILAKLGVKHRREILALHGTVALLEGSSTESHNSARSATAATRLAVVAQ